MESFVMSGPTLAWIELEVPVQSQAWAWVLSAE
jgi:hypothetical protein